MTAETNPPARRRGIYEIGEHELVRLLQLPPGQRLLSVSTNWARLSVTLLVEGDGLPECREGHAPMYLNTFGQFRQGGPLDVTKLRPGAAHAAVLAELGAVRLEDPAALAGRRRILERHAPHDGAPACSSCVDYIGGDRQEWPCEDYLDAAAGLVVGLPGQAGRDHAIAAYAAAQMLIDAGAMGTMSAEEALAVLGAPGAGAILDKLVLGDQAPTAGAPAPTEEAH